MTLSKTYAAHLDAVQAQNARIYGPPPTGDAWGGASARRFRFDPHRDLDRNIEVIASYVGPEDVVIDVGGGAGRVCLPLALKCKIALNVEPSPGMGAEFESLAQEAGIRNARLVPSSLAEAQAPQGDISFTADVTYFVRDIPSFIRQMEAAASRRVIITIWSEPPPNRHSKLFQLVYGEEAIKMVVEDRVIKLDDRERAQSVFEAHFDELFTPSEAGFVPQWRKEMREVLITWETGS